MQEGRIVDQDVDPTGFLSHPREQTRHLRIVAMIARERDAAPAQRIDLACGGVDGAGQRRAAFLLGASGHVHRGACRTERQCDALAGTARAARDDGDDGLFRLLHVCLLH
ncbi:hypothetical protein D3C72_1818800 [compost metagenome]